MLSIDSSRGRGSPRTVSAARGVGAVVAAASTVAALGWVARRLIPGDSLRGEVALVTGGSRGLGFLITEQLLEEGCRVAICARNGDDLVRARERLERESGREVMTWTCDVSERRAVEAMIAAVEERLGPLDLVVNNASVIDVAPLEALTVEDFRRAIDIDFMGTVHTTLAALPGMRARGKGRIANITSIGGKVAVPHLLPYDAAKFAAVGFSEGLRAELARDGISVTTVVPGLMRTGSPVRVRYRGRPAEEYVWFALGDLLPLTAMSAERAARRIVLAIRRREADVVLSWQAKLLRAIHDVAPASSTRLLGLIARMLPEHGDDSARGTELRGALPDAAEKALDEAARRTSQGVEPALRH